MWWLIIFVSVGINLKYLKTTNIVPKYSQVSFPIIMTVHTRSLCNLFVRPTDARGIARPSVLKHDESRLQCHVAKYGQITKTSIALNTTVAPVGVERGIVNVLSRYCDGFARHQEGEVRES
jgi:hypothetical protein